MPNKPTFLRAPDPPRVAQQDLTQPISGQELAELWVKLGIIQRARSNRRISRSDMIGIAALVAALAFSLGYYLAS